MAVKDADGRTADCYLVVEDPQKVSTWHLPVKDPDGTANHRLMGQAWAALHGGLRGNRYSGPMRAQALRKLIAIYKSEGMDLPSAMMSAGDLPEEYQRHLEELRRQQAMADAMGDWFKTVVEAGEATGEVTEKLRSLTAAVAGKSREDNADWERLFALYAADNEEDDSGTPETPRSPLLRRLMGRIRSKLKENNGVISADEVEAAYRHALGHAGGTATARKKASAFGDDDTITTDTEIGAESIVTYASALD